MYDTFLVIPAYIIIGILTAAIIKLIWWDDFNASLVVIGLLWPIFYLLGILLFVFMVIPKTIAYGIRRLFHVC